MHELLTPRQVARAIGVSESSLKRWCDRGMIPMVCTAGGHRRLPISGVLEFIRAQRHTLIHPESIGLPRDTGQRRLGLHAARTLLEQSLIDGDENQSRQIILDLYLDNHQIAILCDQVIAPTFHAIGQRWQCGELEVYRERRACRICIRVLSEIRSLMATPRPEGPLALGATPGGDNYEVPTAMVELVLRQNGWNATSLGSSLPIDTLAVAIAENSPSLFWLSVSHLANPREFMAELPKLLAAAGDRTSLVLGGRGITHEIREQLTGVLFCDSMRQLEELTKPILDRQSKTSELPKVVQEQPLQPGQPGSVTLG